MKSVYLEKNRRQVRIFSHLSKTRRNAYIVSEPLGSTSEEAMTLLPLSLPSGAGGSQPCSPTRQGVLPRRSQLRVACCKYPGFLGSQLCGLGLCLHGHIPSCDSVVTWLSPEDRCHAGFGAHSVWSDLRFIKYMSMNFYPRKVAACSTAGWAHLVSFWRDTTQPRTLASRDRVPSGPFTISFLWFGKPCFTRKME